MIIDNLDDIRADWRSISDQVMGGISEVNFNLLKENEKNFYRLEGNVSTKNNGGFIQSVARIQDDLSEYNGIRLTVRGTEDEYFIWIRTPACRFPGIDTSFLSNLIKIGRQLKFHSISLKNQIFTLKTR